VTVASQVKQTLSSLKSAQASLESFAIETQNQMAKQLFTDAAQQTRNVVNILEPRIQDLEREEPQYRQF